MIEIDGRLGGGQVLRTALALSTFTQKPFRIQNIRASRPKPGLKAQHLNGIELLKKFSKCKCSQTAIGTENLVFHPSSFLGGNKSVDIGTAGSITLLLQTILLPALMIEKKTIVKITGGTNVPFSPSIDYFKEVFLPHLQKFGEIKCHVVKRGYYPMGQGEVHINIKPCPLDGTLKYENKGDLIRIRGVSHASKELELANVTDRQVITAKHTLSNFKCPINIRTEYCDTKSSGTGMALWAYYADKDGESDYYRAKIIGTDLLGKKGLKSEEIGSRCAKKLIEEMEGIVDSHLCDQILPFLAIRGGVINTSKISEHTLSNKYVIEKFLDKKIEIEGKKITV